MCRGCRFGTIFIFRRCLPIAANAKEAQTLLNEEITAKEIRVVTADGEPLGIMSSKEALKIAYEKELDLVMIAPMATPPVCKIMDYGKYHFEREKKEKEQRKKKPSVELKEIQLRCRIDTHDFNTKLKHCIEFLQKGNKVKVIVRFFGREMAHTEVGQELLQRFAAGCGDIVSIDKAPLLDGRNMTMMLSPKKTDNKNKSKGTETNG